MSPQIEKKKRKPFNFYSITQCALYKLTSPAKLSKVLVKTPADIQKLLNSDKNYNEFVLPQETNPFSNKITKSRAVQAPKEDLRSIHERILKLLQKVTPPEYAHASIKKKSYRSNAMTHEGAREIATFDLKSFYSSTKSYLVHNFFTQELKCAGDVASILTKLTTLHGSVPTGSPLSPMLALLAAKPMFNQLEAIAIAHNLSFTCYVDDMTFSGEKIPNSLEHEVTSTVKKYGYRLSSQKTRIYKEKHKKIVTGTVILDRKIMVPNSRFIAVRRILQALDGKYDKCGFTDRELLAKLAGILNEASSLDPKFYSMALAANNSLKRFNQSAQLHSIQPQPTLHSA